MPFLNKGHRSSDAVIIRKSIDFVNCIESPILRFVEGEIRKNGAYGPQSGRASCRSLWSALARVSMA